MYIIFFDGQIPTKKTRRIVMEQVPAPSERNKDRQDQTDGHDEHMQPQAAAECVQEQSTDEVQEQPATQNEGIHLEQPMDCPYQPSAMDIEPLTPLNRTLRFQDSWYKAFPWLHYSDQMKEVFIA
ncbi:hypothetical protein UPYG_G00236200 [Umbra pygmaea]|uniref:Uncharacterized protein n=1 Tax=Umbra pygmaea TaxID=75934 RepID=A0ABD0X4W6_UMBPY